MHTCFDRIALKYEQQQQQQQQQVPQGRVLGKASGPNVAVHVVVQMALTAFIFQKSPLAWERRLHRPGVTQPARGAPMGLPRCPHPTK